MKHQHLPLILVGATLGAVPAAQATLVIHYTFDGNSTISDNDPIVNVAGGTNGIFDIGSAAGNAASIVPSGVAGGFGGNAIRLQPVDDGLGNSGAPNISTGYLVTNGAGGLISNQTNYTAMAWVNFSNTTGDNFIFGGSNPPSGADQMLHHGSRGGGLHNAHWNDDITAGTNAPGTWHHVAYTNVGTTGVQDIYWDGVLVGSGAPGFNNAGGQLMPSHELYIGTSFGSGSFNGFLDEIRVYDTLLSPAEIQAAMVVVPEPATATLAGLVGLAGCVLRRRRGAH